MTASKKKVKIGSDEAVHRVLNLHLDLFDQELHRLESSKRSDSRRWKRFRDLKATVQRALELAYELSEGRKTVTDVIKELREIYDLKARQESMGGQGK
jgi:hypothetical protein